MKSKAKQRSLDAKQVSFILGISEFTVRKLAKAKELPHTLVNRQPMFEMAELLAFFRCLEGSKS